MLTYRGISGCFRTANGVFSGVKGAWFNGRTSVSKTADEGSIPSAPAKKYGVGIAIKVKNLRELVRLMKKMLEFIRGVRAEWFKIVWPTRADVVRATIMIIVFSALAALFFFVVDSILNALVGWIF